MPRDSRSRSRNRSRSVRSGGGRGYQGGERGGANVTIFVAALADSVRESDLQKVFKEEGFVVREAQIPRDRMTGRHRGFAFVDLEDPKLVDDACRKLNGVDFFGRQLKCEPRQPRGEQKGRGKDRGGRGRRDSRRRDSRKRTRKSRSRGRDSRRR